MASGFVRLDLEAKDLSVLNDMGDGVGVQPLLEEVRGAQGDLRIRDFLGGDICLEDGCAGEAEKLGLGEKLFDGLVVLLKLVVVALVEK
jgi:hypothetical protein